MIGLRLPRLPAAVTGRPRLWRSSPREDHGYVTDLVFAIPGGPMLAVIGSCGGAGATRLAFLVACAAGRSPAPVLLADLGGPGAGVAVYAGASSRTSLPALAGEVAREGRAAGRVFASGPLGVRIIASAPIVDEFVDDGALEQVLADAKRTHGLTVLDCGVLARPAERVAGRAATHVAFVVPATPRAVSRAAARLGAVAAECAGQVIVVARSMPGYRSSTPLAALVDLAGAHHAPLVLMPSGGDPVAVSPEVLVDESGLTLQALGALLLRSG